MKKRIGLGFFVVASATNPEANDKSTAQNVSDDIQDDAEGDNCPICWESFADGELKKYDLGCR